MPGVAEASVVSHEGPSNRRAFFFSHEEIQTISGLLDKNADDCQTSRMMKCEPPYEHTLDHGSPSVE